jgi:hypothetical protein
VQSRQQDDGIAKVRQILTEIGDERSRRSRNEVWR